MVTYLIRNKVNGKCYVGLTTRSIEERWKEHCWDAIKPIQVLHKAINKYGADAFDVSTLASAIGGLDNLKELEKQLVAQHNTLVPNGYNLTLGGDGVFGLKFSEQSIQKCKLSHTGFVHSEDTKQKMKLAHSEEKNHFFGQRHSEEAKARISAAKQGSIGPRLGIPVSEETRRKISETLTGKPGRKHTPEAKAKISRAHTGAKRPYISKETRKKLSEASTRSWATRRLNIIQGA